MNLQNNAGLFCERPKPKGVCDAAELEVPELTTFCAQRLVRFLARDGRTYYGDAILPRGVTDIAKAKHAHIIKGDIFGKHDVTDQIADIRLLLAPLAPEDVRTVRCLGLNYEKHAKEVRTSSPETAEELSGPL